MSNQLMNQLWSRKCLHQPAQYRAQAVRVPVRVRDNEHVVPLPRKPARFGRRSAPVNVTQSMSLAGGLGLAAAISAADAFMDLFGQDWEAPSERAGGESRRNENKRKANEITPSAAAKRTNLI